MEEGNEGKFAADIVRYGDADAEADAVMVDVVPDAAMVGNVDADDGTMAAKSELDGVAPSFVSAFFRFRWRDLRFENHV